MIVELSSFKKFKKRVACLATTILRIELMKKFVAIKTTEFLMFLKEIKADEDLVYH